MIATYGGLHELGQSITAYLRSFGGALATATAYGQPLDSPVSSTEAVRVTLMWVTPQPTHRNDAPFRGPTGALIPPPLTLSAYVLITTYGGDADPATSWELLGRVLRIFHETPEVALPVDGVGAGVLTMTLVPTAADLMEKIFTPLQLKHRPFALYEAAPLQLVPEALPTQGAPPVRPGGVALTVTPSPPPAIVRVTPARQAPGGAIRIDLELGGAPITALAIGGTIVPTVAIPDAPAVRAIVPAAVAGDSAPITVRVGPASGRHSPPHLLGLVAATTAGIDAPSAGLASTAVDLILTGRGLTGATVALIWPDDGSPGDGDVRELALTAVAANQVTLSAAAIAAAVAASPGHRSLVGVLVRLVVRLPTGEFTPYVLVRFGP